MIEPITADQLTIVPANEASWEDLQAVFGLADYPGRCYCQHYRSPELRWSLTTEERRCRLRKRTLPPLSASFVDYLINRLRE